MNPECTVEGCHDPQVKGFLVPPNDRCRKHRREFRADKLVQVEVLAGVIVSEAPDGPTDVEAGGTAWLDPEEVNIPALVELGYVREKAKAKASARSGGDGSGS